MNMQTTTTTIKPQSNISPIFKHYEQILIKFFNFVGQYIGIDPDLDVVYGYFLIYRRLTQKQLKQLTHLSQSKVSILLNQMLEDGIVSRKMIPGTHTFQYTLIIRNFQISYHNLNRNKEFRVLGTYLQQFLSKLKQLPAKLQDTQEYQILFRRVTDLYIYSTPFPKENWEKLFELYTQDFDYKSHLPSRTESKQFIFEFSAEMRELEQEFLQNLKKSKAIVNHNRKSVIEILALFFTRITLTQKKIRNLTGFSTGIISEVLNELLELKLIRVIPKRVHRGRSRVYAMDSITISYYRNISHFYGYLSQWQPKIKELFTNLSTNEQNYMHLPGYDTFYTILHKILLKLQNMKHALKINWEYVQKFEKLTTYPV